MEFIGHTLRRNSKDLAKTAMTWDSRGGSKRGRSKDTYMRTVNLLGFNSWDAAASVAHDKPAWKEIITGATVDCGQRY